jgi:hypothetical protein
MRTAGQITSGCRISSRCSFVGPAGIVVPMSGRCPPIFLPEMVARFGTGGPDRSRFFASGPLRSGRKPPRLAAPATTPRWGRLIGNFRGLAYLWACSKRCISRAFRPEGPECLCLKCYVVNRRAVKTQIECHGQVMVVPPHWCNPVERPRHDPILAGAVSIRSFGSRHPSLPHA